MNPDDQLNGLFRAARQEVYEPRTLGMETRLMARIREEKARKHSAGWLAWRVAPFFAALTLAAGVWAWMTPNPSPAAEFAAAELDPQTYSYFVATR